MRGCRGYLLTTVLLLAVLLFFAFSDVRSPSASYTGDVAALGNTFENDVVICPEFECPEDNCGTEECMDAVSIYEDRVLDMEEDISILNEKISAFLLGGCENYNVQIHSDFNEMVDPESVRDFAVFVVSKSSKDPATAIYEYVRNNIRFVSDPVNDYAAAPCRTLLTGGGDCEDHAILLASMLEAVGVDTVLISIPGEHTMVGINLDKMDGLCEKYLHMPFGSKDIVIADTTFSSCIGQVSEEYIEYNNDEWDWKNNPVIYDV